MDYDVILATRNRLSALQISLPLMLSQSRLPRRFVIVDSSDNHQEVARNVTEIFSSSNGEVSLQLLQSTPGSSLQRNIGLDHAVSEVLLFPDDDSLWYPRYAETILKIYEKDADRLIGGVFGQQMYSAPDVSPHSALPYAVELRDRVSRRLQPISRVALFDFIRDPIFLAAREKALGMKAPDWLMA